MSTRCVERHEMKLVRKKYLVTLACLSERENARHIASVFSRVPGDARVESIEQMEDGSVEIEFVEETVQP